MFSVLREEVSNLLKLLGVLPIGETRGILIGFNRELFVAFGNSAKSLLPFVLVDHSVLANVDEIKQVFDHWVRGDFSTSKLVRLGDEFAKVLVGEFLITLLVKESESVIGGGHVEDH